MKILQSFAAFAFVALGVLVAPSPVRAQVVQFDTAGVKTEPMLGETDHLSPVAKTFSESIRQTLTRAQWQEEYDVATRRKNSGKRKMLYGLIGNGVGFVVMMAGVGSCDFYSTDCSGSNALVGIGAITTLAGGGYFVWGLIDYYDARGDMASLERRRPSGAAALPVADGHAIAFTAGRSPSLGYRVSW